MPIVPTSGHLDMRAEVLPPPLLPLFDDAFIRSSEGLEEYVGRLAASIVRDLGAEDSLTKPIQVTQLIDSLKLDADASRVPLDWLLRLLASRGALVVEAGNYYSLPAPLPDLDPEEIRQQQAEHDEAALPSFDIAAFAAQSYPTCLRGEISGERALFAPQRLTHWSRYFNNANPLYAINNRIPAMVAADGGSLGSILELGGGLGSGGAALLEEISAAGRLDEISRYHFTDISPVFLRRGERTLRAAVSELTLETSRLDIDRPLADQGVLGESYDLIFAVNTVHVARDLGATLRQIAVALKPGGRLVLGECIRPFPDQAIYSELVFLLLDSFRNPILHPDYRPAGSFLTPENWRAALEDSGFVDIELTPDITRVREHFPSFLVASVSARRA